MSINQSAGNTNVILFLSLEGELGTGRGRRRRRGGLNFSFNMASFSSLSASDALMAWING